MDATELSVEEVDQKVKSDIQRYGWSILASEYQGLIYAHTIGLVTSFDHPEIETLGLPEELATIFLNELAEWVKAGNRLQVGMTISEFVEGYTFILVTNPVEPKGAPSTNGYLRLIWPDAEHRYPWDPDCEADCALQTMIPETSLPDAETLPV